MSSVSPIQFAPKRGAPVLATGRPFLLRTRALSTKTVPVARLTPGTAATFATSVAGNGSCTG
jgi:hypothetical protein